MGKSRSRSYEYNADCDVCGFTYKASQIRRRWDGLMVCEKDWEMRHPSDFLRVKNDVHKLPFIRERTFKSRMYASVTSDITPVTGSVQVLGFDEELVDQASEFNPATFTFTSAVTTARTFNIGYCLASTGGNSSLEIYLYKNGSLLKSYPPIYTSGAGEARIGASYTDPNTTIGDAYTVRYRITTLNGVIKAYDKGTYFEVN